VLHLSLVMSDPVLPSVHAAFRAIALTVVPESASLEAAEWRAAEDVIEDFLAERPAGIRRQLQLLIRAIDLLPLLRYGRRFTALDASRRLAFLEAMQRFPALLVRRGVWGLRTLVFMGYYGRPTMGAAIGYRADARGWEARR
jgi:hypothetical protein